MKYEMPSIFELWNQIIIDFQLISFYYSGQVTMWTQPLSPVLLKTLRLYYKEYKPQYYLFEGAAGKGTHLGVSAIREICQKARYKTPHIDKRYTPHTFRHCFATHLLEQGTNMLVIQRLMGHANLGNTLKYLHVQKLALEQVINPLDELTGIEGLCQK